MCFTLLEGSDEQKKNKANVVILRAFECVCVRKVSFVLAQVTQSLAKMCLI